MSQPSDEKKREPAEGDDGAVNDPLTNTDVEAPRVPFGSEPDEEK